MCADGTKNKLPTVGKFPDMVTLVIHRRYWFFIG